MAQKSDLRLSSHLSLQLRKQRAEMSVEKKALEYIMNNRFFMISKSWCPDCHYAEAIWKKYGVSDKVEILELDKMDPKEANELEKAFTAIAGRKWVPTIWFDGERFGTEQTLKELESLDKTEEEFKKAGLL
jgi:glutaredoxin 3